MQFDDIEVSIDTLLSFYFVLTILTIASNDFKVTKSNIWVATFL